MGGNMSISSFIKNLIKTDTLFGVKKKKISGVQDTNLFLTQVNFVFNSVDNSIIITDLTYLPGWLTPSKFFRFYSGLKKTTTNSLATDYETECLLTPNTINNSGVKFRVKSIVGNKIYLDEAFSTCSTFSYINTTGTIDGRIAICTNDASICRINATGNTVFNLQKQASSGDEDGSAISLPFVDHYHVFPGTGESSHQYNFSFDYILPTEIITVPARQQMRVYQECRIEGELVCYGTVIVKDI